MYCLKIIATYFLKNPSSYVINWFCSTCCTHYTVLKLVLHWTIWQLAFPKGLPSAAGRPRVQPNSPVIFDVSLEYVPGLDDVEEWTVIHNILFWGSSVWIAREVMSKKGCTISLLLFIECIHFWRFIFCFLGDYSFITNLQVVAKVCLRILMLLLNTSLVV